MKRNRLLLAILTVISAIIPAAATEPGLDHPMTKAVLRAYQQLLDEDPNDYETLLNRANEYYRFDEYTRALADVDRALTCIPVKETTMRADALSLRANIYIQTGRLENAINDLASIISIDPSNYVAIYQRANALYDLGRYSEARVDYTRLQRLNSRSPEAILGLARIAVRENNLGTANELLDQYVSLDPNNADYYVRRADVRLDMGQPDAAVSDLILALATDSRNSGATRRLVALGSTNYPSVIAGLTNAILQAPSVGMYYYLRASIAQSHYRYKAALEDYRTIIDRNLYNYHGIFRSIAECLYAMGQYDQALENVDRALAMDSKTAEANVVRARILRALGRDAEALDAAAAALALRPDLNSALIEMGLDCVARKDYRAAADLFGEASVNAPSDPMPVMLRAWVLGTYLNRPVAARGFYDQIITDSDPLPLEDINTLRGFALLYTDHLAPATAWIDNILSDTPDPDGRKHYLAACFYAAAGNTDAALKATEAALSAGYADYHDWTSADDARITVAPLRNLSDFQQLLQKYAHLW